MFRIDAGRVSPKYCDGQSRRSFLQLGVAGMAAVGLPQLLKVKEASAAAGQLKKDTAVILLWLDGGPGHMDMYDMKPEAPAEYRGLWTPIKTNALKSGPVGCGPTVRPLGSGTLRFVAGKLSALPL